MTAPESTEPASIEALATEVYQLRDLFQRRLLEDRRRQELYDRLCKELDFARSDLVRQFIAPLLRELLLMTDRLRASQAAGADPTDLLKSVEDEVDSILTRRGVRPIPAYGQMFDPRVHEAVDQVSVDRDEDDGRVIEERRSGQLLDDWVLRPVQVVVGHYPSGSPVP